MAPHLLSVTDYLKIITIILGTIVYGLAVYSYDETIIQEEYFLRAVQISALISAIIFACVLLLQVLSGVEVLISKAIDVIWHLIGAIAILLGAGLVLYSTIDNERSYCEILHISYPEHFCQFFKVKLTAGLLALLNGILYAVIATVIILQTTFQISQQRNQKKNQKVWTTADGGSRSRLSTLPKCSFYYGQRY